MAAFVAGDVVSVIYPYTDQSGQKRRPALVLCADHNDVLLCVITSRGFSDSNAIAIPEKDLRSSNLGQTSFVRPYKVFLADSKNIDRKLGNFSKEFLQEVKAALTAWIAE